MPTKTPDLPDDMFNDDTSAISRLTGGSPRRREPASASPTTPAALPTQKEQEKEKEAQRQRRYLKQTSFYLSPDQLLKLDSLAHTHYVQTGARINRNDIVRHLVDRCKLGDLADLV
jgi:hypothetical protein